MLFGTTLSQHRLVVVVEVHTTQTPAGMRCSITPRMDAGVQLCSDPQFPLQVCFDPQFPLPTIAQVECVVLKRFTLLEKYSTSVAPAEKFMMLTFKSMEQARAAAEELPTLLRRHLQKHSAYSIRTHVMSTKRGLEVVKDAAERRRARSRVAAGAAHGSSAAHPDGFASQPALPPHLGSSSGELAPSSGIHMWPQQVVPAAHVMYMPPAMPLMDGAHALSQVRVGAPGMLPPSGMAPPSQPLPAGFLHPVGPEAPAVSVAPAPLYSAEVATASEARAVISPMRTPTSARPAVPEATAAPAAGHGQTGLSGLGVDLAAILDRASGGTTTAAAQVPADAEASNMLSLLKQLGSTGQGSN
jgi:hypothetical protein